MSQRVIYLSAPMTGMPDHNSALFDAAEAHLNQRFPEVEVISPVQLGRADGEQLEGDGWNASDQEWETFLGRDMGHVKRATDLVLLKGWALSGGVGREGRWAIEHDTPLWVLSYAGKAEGWMPLMWISPSYFLAHSTIKRLTPEALHVD